MAHLLDANPELRRQVEFWSQTGEMVPLVQGGEFQAFVNRSRIHLCPVPTPLSVEDFILSMEAMGNRFSIGSSAGSGAERLRLMHDADEPESWQQRRSELLAAFGAGRAEEGIAFLRQRDEAGDPFLSRMDRYDAENVVYNASEDDDAVAPWQGVVRDLESGQLVVASPAAGADALQRAIDLDCIDDTEAELLVRAVMAYLKGQC